MKKHQPNITRLLLSGYALLYFFNINLACAGGTEIFPGDFEPSAPGTNIASYFQYKRDLSGYYVNGKVILGGADLSAHAEVLGLSHYGQINDYTTLITLLLPHISARKTDGTLPPGHGDAFSGWSDPRLAMTIWPVQNNQRSVAISSTLFIPVGEYHDDQAINAGDNRWKATMQVGWIEKLNDKLKLELIPEVTVYGTNHDYVGNHMEQKNAYALTSFLRWRVLPILEAQIGYQANTGGEQTIANFEQDNETKNRRLFMGLTSGLAKNLIVGLRYSRDTALNYELKNTSDIVLRMHYIF